MENHSRELSTPKRGRGREVIVYERSNYKDLGGKMLVFWMWWLATCKWKRPTYFLNKVLQNSKNQFNT